MKALNPIRRWRGRVIVAIALVGVLAVAGVAFSATNASSTFTFKLSPSTLPKTTYKSASLLSNLVTKYKEPGNDHVNGAVERDQIYLDQNWKINPNAVPKCSPAQLAGKTMKQAIAVCGKSLVGTGIATANANGSFIINGCVLLFNGPTQNGQATLDVFDRVQISNPSKITCTSPSTNSQGNGTVLLRGVLKNASAPYGKVLDVNHITQSAAFPLEIFKTTIHKGNYLTARCNSADKTWHMQSTWTYNSGGKVTVKKTQPCTVG